MPIFIGRTEHPTCARYRASNAAPPRCSMSTRACACPRTSFFLSLRVYTFENYHTRSHARPHQEAHDCSDRGDLRASLGALSGGLQQLAAAEALLRGVGDAAAADSLQAKAAEYRDFGAAVARRLCLSVAPADATPPSPSLPPGPPLLFPPPLPPSPSLPPHSDPSRLSAPPPLDAGERGTLASLRQALAAYESPARTAASAAAARLASSPVNAERGRELLGEVRRMCLEPLDSVILNL